MQDWFEVTVTEGTAESPCGEDKCEVNANINIPEFYDCYRSYSLNSIPGKTLLPQNGIVTNYTYSPFNCLEKGEYRADTLYLYRGINDTTPCRIIKSLYCNIELNPEQCEDDCDSVEWDKRSLNLDIDECPNCKVFARYQTRQNTCNDKQDIQIEYFISYGYPDSTACDLCTVSTDEIQKRILLKAILQNSMGFDPEDADGSCDSTWRVVQSSCWATYIKSYGINIISNDTLPRQYEITVPCDSSECCYVGLVVCRFSDPPNPDYISVDTISGGSTLITDCQLSQHYFLRGPFVGGGGGGAGSPGSASFHFKLDSANCINRCDWMFGISENSYSGKQATEDNMYEMRNISISDDVNLMMFNYSDIIHFEIISGIPDSKEIKFSLFSIQGQELISNTDKLNKGKNYYQLPVQTLISGVYFVNIMIDGIYHKTEKVIIIR
ncbi:MAG: T9SS type A sorting domain-containing protein [Candidatus Kapabacteria bacterium]|nr:T9SS type A sorting domain-containing protein [Ignavibacteriota bacterium]MCW5886207.1 T9SS type A sorting domain-containing protein [Candidatus Kapabacteria bacterium]